MQINKLPELVKDWHVQKQKNEYYFYSIAGNKEGPEIVVKLDPEWGCLMIKYVWSLDFMADFISSCKISGYDGKTVLDDWIVARLQKHLGD